MVSFQNFVNFDDNSIRSDEFDESVAHFGERAALVYEFVETRFNFGEDVAI